MFIDSTVLVEMPVFIGYSYIVLYLKKIVDEISTKKEMNMDELSQNVESP